MIRDVGVVVTCEHATARIPARYGRWFRGKGRLLASHRGSDLGAADVATRIAGAMGAPVLLGRVSRLLVDLNRSPHHPKLFSEISRRLPRTERDRIVRELHDPHWASAESAIARASGRGVAVHWAIHSFTPVLDGNVRNADIGLLYDPTRPQEKRLANALRAAISEEVPSLKVRRNYPYRGIADGLATALRRRYPGSRYAGMEIEINQSLLVTPRERREVAGGLARAMLRAMAL